MKILYKVLTTLFLLVGGLTLLMKCDDWVDPDFTLPDDQLIGLLYFLAGNLLLILTVKTAIVLKERE